MTTASITKQNLRPFMETGAISDSYLSLTEHRPAWQKLIDFCLLDWAMRYRQGDSEDSIPPTSQAVHTAIQVARFAPEADWPAPTKCVGTGDGGIAFEWGRQGGKLLTLEIDETGRAEFIAFENCKIEYRAPLM
jgi:hypothetical protein